MFFAFFHPRKANLSLIAKRLIFTPLAVDVDCLAVNAENLIAKCPLHPLWRWMSFLAVDVDFLVVNPEKSQNFLEVDSAFWRWIRPFGGGSDLLAVS